MTHHLPIACIQLAATGDKAGNVERAEQLVRAAAARGARVVALPEKWSAIGDADVLVANAEPATGETLAQVAGWARELGIWVLAGSVITRVDDDDARLLNLSVLIGPDGRQHASYAKTHMFDIDVDGIAYRESEASRPGNTLAIAELDGVTVGLTVCYDLRFPELYRLLALRGARIIFVPAAFTTATGRDHWEPLLRARAIENQCFVVAPNVFGAHGAGKNSYGRSMVIDPWGTVLATAPDGEGVIVVDLDLDAVDRVRAAIPVFSHRRGDLYGFRDE
ncbi:MAG: Nitrilase/cyanide hydratase and apolipoprotein N-acyltransferase [Thermoleophilia bacterium]|nr:Nitrilase/cyanide hydratase and apolipoprotein N-acyltransferase [Thermoleophilia bacterium]